MLWTEDSEAHIARHGVQPSEVEQALYGRPRLSTAGRKATTLVLGTSNEGRHLLSSLRPPTVETSSSPRAT